MALHPGLAGCLPSRVGGVPSTTLTHTRRDDRGREILELLETVAPAAFRWTFKTGARSYWTGAPDVPGGGYGVALEMVESDLAIASRAWLGPDMRFPRL